MVLHVKDCVILHKKGYVQNFGLTKVFRAILKKLKKVSNDYIWIVVRPGKLSVKTERKGFTLFCIWVIIDGEKVED